MPATDSCIAFLIRHGATDNNVADPPLLQGRGVDGGLSLQGKGQAEDAARLLANQRLAAVYSSPLVRAMETAECIARPHGLEVKTVDALVESDVGRWESRSWGEIQETEPDNYRRFMEDASTFGYPEGENMEQVLARVAPAIERVMQTHLGERIVIVGHNVVNRVFLSHLLGVPLSKARRISHDNCGVSIVKRRDNSMKLVTLNSNFHLTDPS